MMRTQGNLGGSFIFVGVILAIVRIIVVLLWSIVGHHAIGANLWVELGLTVLSLLIVTAIAGAMVVYFGRRLSREFRYETIITTTTIYSVSTLALLLFAALVPGELYGATPLSWVTVVTSHMIAIGTYTISVGLAAFLTVVALQRQHRRTRLYLVIQSACVIGVWLTAMLLDVGSAFEAIAVILVVIGSFVTLLNIRRLNWIGTIKLERKVRLLWLCACGAFAAIVLTFMLTLGSGSYMMQSTRMFLSNGTSLPVVPAVLNLFGFLFFVRMFIATLASLPNSGLIDRRSGEVQALSGLTRLVAQSASVDDLLSSVTQYTLTVCGAHGAWCELYDNDGLRIVSPQLISTSYVQQLHRDAKVSALFRNTKEALHIDSLADLYDSAPNSSVVRSLIAIPLKVGVEHLGSVIMFSTVDYGFEQEDVALLTAFADTISVGLEQARLQESSLEKERLQREFEVARSIQISLLPKTSPANAKWEIDAVMIPATRVGGDYYDFIEFANGNCGAVIADVSGKGVPAALYMATLKGVVLAQSRASSGPADLLKKINETLYNTMDRRVYISMAAVELDPVRGLRMARAGHTPILVCKTGNVQTHCPRGAAIGLLPTSQFAAILDEECVAVHHGDFCLLTTDGVTERRNADMEELTTIPLERLLSETSNSVTEVVQRTIQIVNVHGEGTDAHDDITIVAIRVLGDPATAADGVSIQEHEGAIL